MLQRRGVDAVFAAIHSGEATLVLLERENPEPRLEEIRNLLEKGISKSKKEVEPMFGGWHFRLRKENLNIL